MAMTDVFRLGRDAEVRHTAGGDAVANLNLAYNYGRKGDDGRYPSQWIEGALWGKLAEALGQYLTKGKQVFATLDDVRIETYTNRDGVDVPKLVGRVTTIKLVGDGGSREGGEREERRSAAPRPAPPAQAAKSGGGFDDMDDEIPF